jgi:hypothetical protein
MMKIEFRELGSRDSLTGAPGFAIFQSHLIRAIAANGRNPQPLSVLSLRLSGNVKVSHVIVAHQAILKVLRKEDFYCRASESGFWIGMISQAVGAEVALARLITSIKLLLAGDAISKADRTPHTTKPVMVKGQRLLLGNQEKISDFIERIDEVHFRS